MIADLRDSNSHISRYIIHSADEFADLASMYGNMQDILDKRGSENNRGDGGDGGDRDIRSVLQPDIILEIGYGNGDHVVQLANMYPNALIIGSEPYINGSLQLINALESGGIGNVRIWIDDIMDCMPYISSHSLNEIYILCPDPWPKKRHHKKRLIQRDFIFTLLDKMKDGGRIVIATDDESYAAWIDDICDNIMDLSRLDDGKSGDIYFDRKREDCELDEKNDSNRSKIAGKVDYSRFKFATLEECIKFNIDSKYIRRALSSDFCDIDSKPEIHVFSFVRNMRT